MIRPCTFTKRKCSIGDSKYEKFLIGIDKDGNEIKHSCNPKNLSGYFTEDESKIPYFTPIFFDLEVMARYKDNPLKYRIDDDCISLLQTGETISFFMT